MQHGSDQNGQCPASTSDAPSFESWYNSICVSDTYNPASYGALPTIQTASPPALEVGPSLNPTWTQIAEDFPDLFYDSSDAPDYVMDVQEHRQTIYQAPSRFNVSVHTSEINDPGWCYVCRRPVDRNQDGLEDRTISCVLPGNRTDAGFVGNASPDPQPVFLQESNAPNRTCSCCPRSSHSVEVRSRDIDGGTFSNLEHGIDLHVYSSGLSRRGWWGNSHMVRIENVHAMVTAKISAVENNGDVVFYDAITFPDGHIWEDDD